MNTINRSLTLAIAFFSSLLIQAQRADTINLNTMKLNTSLFKARKATYIVYMYGKDGKRLGAGSIWDREVTIREQANGKKEFTFDWKWYMKDTVMAHVTSSGKLPSLELSTHQANYFKYGKSSYRFSGAKVSIPVEEQHSRKDSAFSVVMNPHAYAFPMDLELYGLLPFQRVGQRFVMAFYEPGKRTSAYYNLLVKSKEQMSLPGGASVECWVLYVDYNMPGSSALFWISTHTGEVLKVDEDFPGGKSYKVKLY